jgi:hypothetical protein
VEEGAFECLHFKKTNKNVNLFLNGIFFTRGAFTHKVAIVFTCIQEPKVSKSTFESLSWMDGQNFEASIQLSQNLT